jgi:protoporphyrinogen oxidase
MIKTDVLIVGGGLTGLSAARALQGKTGYLLAEKEGGLGGLAASVRKNGFTFDYSGHLLHLRWDRTTTLILRLLNGNHLKIKRNARIHLAGAETPYPFQANLYGLPDRIRSECVRGFLEACLKGRGGREHAREGMPFSTWSLNTFGTGISKHFMLPYNSKLWRYPLDRLTADWCAPFVPMPTPAEVIEGAYLRSRTAMGYNPVFYYPKKGGIQALPDAMAEGLTDLHTGCALEAIDIKAKIASVKGLGEIKYSRLINTMPLKSFIELMPPRQARLRKLAAKLRHNSVHVLNLGVRSAVSKAHWTYFPEKEFLFYRAGIATNFSTRLAPRGRASLYIETATSGASLDRTDAEKKILRGLVRGGIIKSEADVVEKLWLTIPCAYVIYDAARGKVLPETLSALAARGVHSIGRYGAWKYSFMEESVKEGLEAAEEILRARE